MARRVPLLGGGRTAPETASSGKIARIGITARSWNNRTENEVWPPLLLSKPFSFNVWSAMAVEEAEKIIPIAKAGLNPESQG